MGFNVQIKFSAGGADRTIGEIKRILQAANQASAATQSAFEKIGQTAFNFNQIIQGVQTLVSALRPAYDLLIGQNEQLNQELLGSQANLAATNKILKDGVELKDPKEAIQALEGPIKEAIEKIQKDSLQLVGVTSKDLIGVFNVLTAQAANLTNQSKEFPESIEAAQKLTTSFSAALGTIGLPLNQARQEINSILSGTIDMNSVLAKQLGITNDNVQAWKAQGVLVDELQVRLKPFVDGNALAARSIGGITSNLQEILELTTRTAGEPLLEPLVAALEQLFNFLQENQDAIEQFTSDAAIKFLGLIENIGQAAARIGEALLPALEALGPAAGNSIDLLVEGFITLTNAIAAATEAASPLLKVTGDFVSAIPQGLKQAQENIANLTGQIQDSNEAVEAYGNATDRIFQDGLKNVKALKEALDARNEAEDHHQQLTEQQLTKEKQVREAAQAQIEALKQQRQELLKANVVGAENEASIKGQIIVIDAQIKQIERLNKSFKTSSSNVKVQAKDLQELGDIYTQLEKKATDARRALAEGAGGDSARAQKAAEELIGLTQQRLELGKISAQEAFKELEAVKNNTKLSYEQQQAAIEAISKIRQQELDRQIEGYKTQQDEIKALSDAGVISQGMAETRITELKQKELKIRLDNTRKALATEQQEGRGTGTRARELQQQEREIQISIIQEQAKGQRQRNELRLKDFDEAKAILEAKNAQGLISQQQFNQRSLNLTQQRLAEESRQLRERASKLSATDKQGLEEIAAKEADILKQRAEALKAFYEAETKRLADIASQRQAILDADLARGLISQEDYAKKSLAIIKQATDHELALIQKQRASIPKTNTEQLEALAAREAQILARRSKANDDYLKARETALTNSLDKNADAISQANIQAETQIQQLLNQQLITETQANQKRLQLARDRISQELAAEKQKREALQQLSFSNPELNEQNEQRIRDSLLRTAQLQKDLADNAYQQLQASNSLAIKAIQDRGEAQKNATSKILSNFDREKAALENLNKSYELASRLLESRADVQKASSDLVLAQQDIELDRINQLIAYRQQLDQIDDNPEEKLAIQQAISSLGEQAAGTEIELLQQRQQIERQINEEKRKALLQEQERQRQALELDLARNKLAAERAVIEAKQAEIQAQQNVLEAQNNLLIAQKNPEDKQAIANAQAALDLARQSVTLAGENLQATRDQLVAQDELAQNTREALALNQDRELRQFEAASQKQQRDSTLEISKAQADQKRAAQQQQQKQQEQLSKSMESTAKAADGLAESFEKLDEEAKKPKSRTVTFTSRREGGIMNAGEPYLVGDGPGGKFIPGVSEVVVPKATSYAIAARKVAEIFSPPAATIRAIPVNSGRDSGQKALLKEIQGLRADIKERRPINPQFTFNRESGSEMDAMTQIIDILRSTMPL